MNLTPSKARKNLGVFALIMINVIAVDSLRSLPFSAAYGFSLVFFYLFAAVVFYFPTAFVSAELATGWPDKGGVYVWVREAFGELWGFIVIWLQWIYNVVWYPTILTFTAGILAFLINPNLAENKIYMVACILIVFWGATIVNCFGMRLSSWVSTIGALIGTLLPMLFITILGIIWIKQGNPMQIKLTSDQFLPNLTSVNNLSFLLAIFFGLVGMEMSATHADEVKNPHKAFPRAILYSAILILFSLVFSSLAIAVVVPHQTLNVVTGLVQAFEIFFNNYHLQWMTPVIAILIVIGCIAGVSTWVIGPTKGLLVATLDGSAPKFLGKINRHGVPTVILFLQAVICTIICLVFLLMPTVSSSYWVLTAITAQLAMMVYIGLFAAGIYLRYKKPNTVRAYKVPGGNVGMWIMGLLGIISSIGAIGLGFIPPSQVEVGNIWRYESLLVIGMIVLCLPPVFIYKLYRSETPLPLGEG